MSSTVPSTRYAQPCLLPNTSLIRHSQAFYDLHIEDMWLPYFCNTTNINTSTMEIHETGYAWRFIRESLQQREDIFGNNASM